ncbi:choice-of-anchor D domain-containing protein [Blastopirellula retiformator]|uniref:choice-of-anchor D domain-containing protein n=1 Tax=Blastopirellula retiformator TaxID=2527970 RepID=UPI001649597E|nr:choice-of-anchor D domain-containing protein [Blastopirellula retiformator]
MTLSYVAPSPAPEIAVSTSGTGNIPDNTGSVSFGSTTVGTPVYKTFTVNNTGNANLVLDQINLPTGFSLLKDFGDTTPGAYSDNNSSTTLTVAANSSTTFQVQMNAAAVGTFSGTLSFTTNDSDENPFNFTISGSVAGVPEIAVFPNLTATGDEIDDNVDVISLGSSPTGATVTKKFLVRNTGTGVLSLNSINLPSGYSLLHDFTSTSLAPNTTTTFEIELDTSVSGTFAGEISFGTNDNTDGENPFNFYVTATVYDVPEIAVSTSGTGNISDNTGSVSFGNTTVGTPVYKTFTVNNTGNANLVLDQINLPTGFSLLKDFGDTTPGAYSDNNSSTTLTVAANSSTTFQVQMNAAAVGTFSGTLSFTTNDSDENPFNFTISGEVTGYAASVSPEDDQDPIANQDTESTDPNVCNCSCGCDSGTDLDVNVQNTVTADTVQLVVEVSVDPALQISDTLTVTASIGGVAMTTSDTSAFNLSGSRSENLLGKVVFTIARSALSGDGNIDYTVTLTSANDWLEDGPHEETGQVDIGTGGVATNGVMKANVRTNGIDLNLGNGRSIYLASDGLGGYDMPEGEFGSFGALSGGGYQYTSRYGHTYVFDSDGYQTSRTQADGHETTYSYTTSGGKKVLAGISGAEDTFTYAYTSGKLTSITNTKGWLMSMTYDTNGLLETITREDPDGAGPLAAPVTTYAYNSGGQITSITKPGGLVTSYTYDSTGRVATVTEPDGSVTTYSSATKSLVDNGTSIETITDSQGITMQYEYDSLGNVIREIDGEGNETIYERDANGLATKITYADPDDAGPLTSSVFEYTYDSRGNMLTETLPDASVRTWVYHTTWNKPVQYTDANGNISLYAYDSTHKWLLSETAVVGVIDDLVNLETDDLTYTYTYTPAPTTTGDAPIGLLASMTAPDGVVTEYEYDEDGNLTKTTFAAGTADEAYTTATYDSAGNMLTETDELGNVTTYTYDALSRVTSMTSADPDGAGPQVASVISYTYNAMGFIATETLNSRTTTYAYNSSGTLTSVTEEDPDDAGPLTAPVTSYTYDSHGNVLTITDPLGAVTTYGYTDGLLTSITEADPDGAGPQSSPVTTFTYNDNGQILTETDPLGRVTTYTYDDLGRLIEATLPDPDGAVVTLQSLSETTTYDVMGRIASITDIYGVTTSYTYDHEGNLLTETTPLGTTTYEYDELNRLVKETSADPDGAGALSAFVTIYAYNAVGMLASVTTSSGVTSYAYDNRRRRTSVTLPDPDGAGSQTAPVTSYTYDDAGNLLTETDALGRITSYDYDALNRQIEVTSPDPDDAGPLTSPVTSYEYDEYGQLVSMTDPNGGVTSYDYDDLGRLVKEILADPDGAGALVSPEIEYAYDAAGQLYSVTDELGNITTYDYDALGRLIKITAADPDGPGGQTAPITSYVFDAAGQLTSETDPLGRKTSYTYDAMGRLLVETLPDPDEAGPLTVPYTSYTYGSDGRLTSTIDTEGQTVSYTYTSAGQVATMTDPRGVTTYAYDALGRTISTTEPDPDGAGPLSAPVTTYAYNDDGQLESMSTSEGTTSYEYDDLGRTVKVTMPDPDGGGSLLAAWTIYEYDALGRTVSETDRLGHETSYDYDNLGRLIKKTDAEGGETEYTYDANGNRLTLTDPEENTTTWTYDLLNRMLTNTNELNDTRYYEYDAAGNLVEYTDRNGRVIEYEYDNLQRRISETWLDGVTTVNTITYGYDAASQLVSVADSTAAYDFTYDRLGRITSTEVDLAALGYDVVLDQAYDALNRRISLAAEIDGTDDFKNEYAYDFLNRLTQVNQAGQVGGNTVAEKRVDFTYDADDKYQFTSITRYADLAGTDTIATSTYGYDFADRLTSLTYVDSGSSTLAGYTWSYDSANRVTGFTVYGHSAEDATYNYDDTNQLEGADYTGTANDESYTYDDNGNRTNTGYSTGDNNQLLSDGTYNYTYDAEGNRLTRTNISTGDYEVFEYDHRDRLESVTKYDDSDVKQWKVDYGYDAFNQLVSREADTNGDGTVDQSGYFIIDNGQIVLVLDDTGDVEHRTLWGPQVDQLLADENGAGDLFWALTDNQNTVRDYVEYDDSTDVTSIVNHIAYDAVGKVASETNGSLDAFRFRYTGKYVDPLTGLQYNLNRWYDPATARWMSQDPIEFEAGDANLYRYVGNGHLSWVDPSGLVPAWPVRGSRYYGGTMITEDVEKGIHSPHVVISSFVVPAVIAGGAAAVAAGAIPAATSAGSSAMTSLNSATTSAYIYGSSAASTTTGKALITAGGGALAGLDYYYRYEEAGGHNGALNSYCTDMQRDPALFHFTWEQQLLRSGVRSASTSLADDIEDFYAGQQRRNSGTRSSLLGPDGKPLSGPSLNDTYKPLLGADGKPIHDPNILSGHGVFLPGNGTVKVPEGTSVTVYTNHGNTIFDDVGGKVDQGLTPDYYEIYGAQTYLPGAQMPNYTLTPPSGLHIQGNPTTVTRPYNLSSFLRPNQGNVKWSACVEEIESLESVGVKVNPEAP